MAAAVAAGMQAMIEENPEKKPPRSPADNAPRAEASASGFRAGGGVSAAIWNVGKWLVMAVAVWYLWREGMLSAERLRLTPEAAYGLPAAVVCLGACTAFVAYRFHRLLRCLGVDSRLAGQARIHFSGLLAQQIGSEVAYDAMRVLGSRSMGGGTADIVAAAVVDRLLGLLSLTAVAAASLAAAWGGTAWLAAALFPPLAAAGLVGCVALGRAASSPGASRLRRVPGVGFAVGVCGALARYRSRGATLLALFFLAVAGHMCFFAALYFCGVSLAGAGASLAEAVAGGAASSYTAALPLPMAGLGVGEAAFGEVVSRMRGSGEAADFAPVFLANRLLLLALGAASWLWLSLSGGGPRGAAGDGA